MTVFLAWLRNLPYTDTIERQQAALLQVMLLFVIGSTVVGLPISLITTDPGGRVVSVLSYVLIFVCMIGALAILRRGRLRAAAMLSVVVLVLVIGSSLFVVGLANAQSVLASLVVPIVLGGLTIGRTGLITSAGLVILLVAATAILETQGVSLIGATVGRTATPVNVAATYVSSIIVIGLLLDRFGNSLRDALRTAQSREHELETLRDSLEVQVAEQTAELKTALVDVKQREARLRQLVQDLQEARNTVRDMSSPVIPVLDGVLVVPLIGAVDETRADELSENVLNAVERERARYVILDVTGLPIIDTHAARSLMQASDAVRLLGAQTMLAGIRPEVAQTLVSLGVDLSDVPAYAGLREAVAMLARDQLRAAE